MEQVDFTRPEYDVGSTVNLQQPQPANQVTSEDISVLIVTGMSGAGRRTAGQILEELGWYVVDNIPVTMLDTLVEQSIQHLASIDKLAIILDVRSVDFSASWAAALSRVEGLVSDVSVLFLDCSSDVLVQRYNHLRRRHPLQGDDGLLAGISRERDLMVGPQTRADVLIDTTPLSVHQLQRRLLAHFHQEDESFQITVESFGFKYGVPMDVDLMVDMRFLPNPYWVPELRSLNGRDRAVSDYVTERDELSPYFDSLLNLVEISATGFKVEGKRFMTVGVGCTGGKHRSVAVTEKLTALITSRSGLMATAVHRDLGKE